MWDFLQFPLTALPRRKILLLFTLAMLRSIVHSWEIISISEYVQKEEFYAKY